MKKHKNDYVEMNYAMHKNNYIQDYSKVYESLGIIESELPDLSRYYARIERTNSSCKKSWGSTERYVNALYWMKFVKQFDWYDIAQITGNNYIAVRYNYEPFGWYNDLQTLEECEAKEREAIQFVENALANIDSSPEVFQQQDYLEKLEKIEDKALQSRTSRTFHVSTEKELFRILYYLVIASEITTKDVARYYDTTPGNLRRYLDKYNISLSRKESRNRTESKGNGNHVKARLTFQKNTLRHALVYGLSNEYELLFRDLITSYFPDYLDILDEYEIIVGVQTLSIIPPQEIDIPIIIISKDSGHIYKYAIELNGDVWHERNQKHHMRDVKKNSVIETTAWKLITIVFSKMVTSPTKVRNVFVDLTKKVCEIIAEDIQVYDNSWKRRVLHSWIDFGKR